MVRTTQPRLLLNAPKKKAFPTPLEVLTSPLTTIALGATLGALLFPAAALGLATGAGKKLFGTPLRALGTVGAAGILTTSPKIRGLLDPRRTFQRGKEVGKIIEDPSKLIPKDITPRTVGQKIKGIAKKAGLVGGVAAATVGGVVLAKGAVKKVKSLLPGAQAASQPVVTFDTLPRALPPSAPALSTIAQPLGAVEAPQEPKAVSAQPAAFPAIRITNKPQNNINIKISKSRKFINQQVLVRS